ncbi:hypothetical protein HB779_13685 [Phyllobacterium sp. 628]|uniref:hypothetical protein n=1 Tax=Phyllobacterium sp. 628 TaxID=2718938 RepID=UPI0016623BD7|nr:hypothetical protein [Phyllobacterium sp. 628]QND52840.1 hypothetical protein HB779_13685 [Phyllobacterium sp. 628]
MKLKALCVTGLMVLAGCDDGENQKQAENTPPTFGEVQTVQPAPPVSDAPAPQNTVAAFVWPVDHAVIDPNHYYEGEDSEALHSAAYKSGPNGGAGDTTDDIAAAGLDLSAVDETPSSKHQQLSINGQAIDYTAQAGHLIAYAPADPANPQAARDAEASIFYMSYTREDIPVACPHEAIRV